MNKTVSLFFAMIMVSAVLTAPALSSEDTSDSSATLSLLAFSSKLVTLDKGKPLLLQVSISNPTSIAASLNRAHAKRRLDRLKASGQLNDISETEHQRLSAGANSLPSPGIKLGSEKSPLFKLVKFTTRDSRDTQVELKVRPLAVTTALEKEFVIDEKGSFFLLFGIEASELDKLRYGKYRLQATLDTRAQSDMWQGYETSNEVTLNLVSKVSGESAVTDRILAYRCGRYYLLDAQYKSVEPWEKMLLDSDMESVWGWELRGDRLLATGKLKEAEEAFRKALKSYDEDTKEIYSRQDLKRIIIEPPSYLWSRLNDIRDLKSKMRTSGRKID